LKKEKNPTDQYAEWMNLPSEDSTIENVFEKDLSLSQTIPSQLSEGEKNVNKKDASYINSKLLDMLDTNSKDDDLSAFLDDSFLKSHLNSDENLLSANDIEQEWDKVAFLKNKKNKKKSLNIIFFKIFPPTPPPEICKNTQVQFGRAPSPDYSIPLEERYHKNITKAWQLFGSLHKDKNVSPDIITLNSLLAVHSEALDVARQTIIIIIIIIITIIYSILFYKNITERRNV